MSRGPGAVQRHIVDILAATAAPTPAVPGGQPLTSEEIRAAWHHRTANNERMRKLVDATSDDMLLRRTPEPMRYEGGRVPVPAQPPPWVTLRDMVGDDASAAKVESYRRAIRSLAAAGRIEAALVRREVPVRTGGRYNRNPVVMLPREVLAARLPVTLDQTA